LQQFFTPRGTIAIGKSAFDYGKVELANAIAGTAVNPAVNTLGQSLSSIQAQV
jgi:hypothetical protein